MLSKNWGLNVLLKVIFASFLAYFIYKQAFQNEDFSGSWAHFIDRINQGNPIHLILVIICIFFNWALESLKWQQLLRPFLKLTFKRSFISVLCGIALAVLTPNRIGEYAGRMLMVEAKYNWKAVFSTLVSSFAQNIWNIGLGFIAALTFLFQFLNASDPLSLSGFVLSFLLFGMMIFLYFNLPLFSKILYYFRRYRIVNTIYLQSLVFDQYKNPILFKILWIALLRYTVYFLQYYLLLSFFGLHLSILDGFICVGTIFLIQSSLPLPPVISFLARGEIAILVFSTFQFPEISILAASYSLWILNVFFPSLAGALFVFNNNLTRSLGIEKMIFQKRQKLF